MVPSLVSANEDAHLYNGDKDNDKVMTTAMTKQRDRKAYVCIVK